MWPGMGPNEMATTLIFRVIEELRQAERRRAAGGSTDGCLLGQFVEQQDGTAFEALVRRHGPMVLGVCRRVVGNIHDAEDAFQATFLVLARRAASLRDRERLGSWLYGVAYRTALQARRQNARRGAREKQVLDMPHPPVQPRDEAGHELRRLLDEELSRLPDKYRLPVVLCELEGRSRKEVAGQLGLPEGTVSSRLATARKKLAARLTRRGVTLSAGGLAAVLSPQGASASVPAPLVGATVKAAVLVAAGRAVAGTVPAKVAVLTQGVLHAMSRKKAIIVFGVLLAGLAGTGMGALAFRGHQPAVPDVEPAAPQAAVPKRPAEAPFVLAGKELVALPARKPATFVALRPGSQTLTAVSAPGELTRWDLNTRQADAPRQLPGGKVIGLSADGSVAVTAAGRAVTVVDTATGRRLAALETAGPPPGATAAHETQVPGQKFNLDAFHPSFAVLAPDNRAVAVGAWNLEVWSLADSTPKRIAALAQTSGFSAFAFSPDGARVAYVGLNRDEGLSVWDLGAQRRVLHAPTPPDLGDPRQVNRPSAVVSMRDVVFTPDGKTVLVGGTCHHSWTNNLRQRNEARMCWLRAWDAATGVERYTREFRVAKDQEADIIAVVISKAGVLAAGAADGTVKLWLAASGRELGAVRTPARSAYRVALSADAKTLVVASGSIQLFELAKRPAPPGPAPEPADAWKPPVPSPAAAAYQDVVRDYEAWVERGQREAETADAKTEEARRRLSEKYSPQLRAFARRFLGLAQEYPQDPAAVDALWWLVETMGHGPEADRAVEILAHDHLADASNAARLKRVTGAPHAAATRALLRAFAERGATRDVRAQASFLLAKSLLAAAEIAEQLHRDESGDVARRLAWDYPLGGELVQFFRGEDAKRLTTEAEKLLHEVAERHAAVPHPYLNGTLGDAAEWELAELRHPTLAVGKPAPEIGGKDAVGEAFKLSDYRGTVVLLTFSANWCAPCRAMYAHERRLVARLQGKPFAAVSVNADATRATLEESIHKAEITWRCWWDGLEGPITKQWHIEGIPSVFVIDAQGIIRFKQVQGEALEKAVNALLQEAQAAAVK